MRTSTWSIVALAAAFTLTFAGLLRSLYRVQVEDVADFKRDLAIQSTRRMGTPGTRGRILDSRGGVLAGSRPRRDIACNASAFASVSGRPVAKAMESEIVRLAAALGIDRPAAITEESIARHIRISGAVPLCVWRDVDETTLAKFAENAAGFPGFSIVTCAERSYPRGTFAAHVIGYTGKDGLDIGDPGLLSYGLATKGRSGVEAFYDDYLAGVPGTVRVSVDARGFKPAGLAKDAVSGGESEEREPQNGLDLVLSIDPAVQEAAERQLAGVSGACVAIDPRDGSVLAMASSPAFDPGDFVPSISAERYRKLATDPGKPLLNRATAGLYAPGSTFKPITAIAALESGIKPDGVYDCTGKYVLGDMQLRCWNRWGHGELDMRQALEQSCNPYFARLGYLIGSNSLFRTAHAFGLESKTGIDCSPDFPGSLVSPPFYPGLVCQTAIGQGRLQVTPLQMAVVCAALANGGKVYAPRLKKRSPGEPPPEPAGTVGCRPEDMELVRAGMRDVVEGSRGTGRSLAGLGISCAGKTGTAEIAGGSRNAWMIAFAPYENPEIAIAIVVENGEGGSKTAVPRVRKILAAAFGLQEGSR